MNNTKHLQVSAKTKTWAIHWLIVSLKVARNRGPGNEVVRRSFRQFYTGQCLQWTVLCGVNHALMSGNYYNCWCPKCNCGWNRRNFEEGSMEARNATCSNCLEDINVSPRYMNGNPLNQAIVIRGFNAFGQRSHGTAAIHFTPACVEKDKRKDTLYTYIFFRNWSGMQWRSTVSIVISNVNWKI